MRSDIKYLLCERERVGSSHPSLKWAKRLNPDCDYEDYDSGPCRASSARNWQKGNGLDHKTLNENLNPLYRFLKTSVGRPWNDVYSEIRAQIDPRRANGFHVLQHVGWYVNLTFDIEDRYTHFVVDGEGKLQRGPASVRSSRRKRKEPVTSVFWENDRYFEWRTFRRTRCGCNVTSSQAECQHHNPTTTQHVCYVIQYGWHKPDEVCRYVDRLGVVTPVYYRDLAPEKARYVVSSKVANKKELRILAQLREKL